MYKVTIMIDYVHQYFKGVPECVEYTNKLAEVLDYKVIAKHQGNYLEFNFYNNFFPTRDKVIR